jgi:hypothetical protein
MIITDLNYCKRCRKPNLVSNKNRTNYCTKCAANIGRNPYTRYSSSSNFINTSFEDAIDGDYWNGFTKIKYTKQIIQKIIDKFNNINHVISDNKLYKFKNFVNQPFLYLVSDGKKNLLKIGQTVNPFNRFSQYHNISEHKPIRFDLFSVGSFIEQDLYEDKLRNYLEFLGYLLPKDNTNCRLKYI